jgi:hypothetical protein
VWFHREARVTIQQMGATSRDRAAMLVRGGAEIEPTSVQDNVRYVGFLDEKRTIEDPDLPNGVAIMYRRDDVSAVALFYLDRPENGLPPLQPLEKRIEAIQ